MMKSQNQTPNPTPSPTPDPLADDAVGQMLRRQLQHSSAYLADDGFSAGVMAALPVRRQLNPWLARLLVWLPTLLISLLVVAQLPWRELLQGSYAWLLSVNIGGLILLGLAFLLLIGSIPLLWALRRQALL